MRHKTQAIGAAVGLRGFKPSMYDGPMGQARNPYTVEGDTITLELTRGYTTAISLADFSAAADVHWCALITKCGNVYAVNGRGAYLHKRVHGESCGLDIDHIDGDGLNNRRSNLRAATRLQNLGNMRMSSHNTSGYKGVSFRKRDGTWQALIGSSPMIYLGTFTTPEDAARAYDRAAVDRFGPFARTNAALGLL